MAQSELNTVEAMLEVARKVARYRFPHSPELQADVVSTAWELSLTAGEHATPLTLAAYAVRRVKIRRQFKQSIRTIEAERKDRPEFNRIDLNLTELPDDHDLPAESAIMRVDFAEFRLTLTARQLVILDAMLMGETTGEMAERFGLTPGRIAQMRREFHTRLQVFLS